MIWSFLYRAWGYGQQCLLGEGSRSVRFGIGTTRGTEIWDFSKHLMAPYQTLDAPASE